MGLSEEEKKFLQYLLECEAVAASALDGAMSSGKNFTELLEGIGDAVDEDRLFAAGLASRRDFYRIPALEADMETVSSLPRSSVLNLLEKHSVVPLHKTCNALCLGVLRSHPFDGVGIGKLFEGEALLFCLLGIREFLAIAKKIKDKPV